jgi:hypothetical protein
MQFILLQVAIRSPILPTEVSPRNLTISNQFLTGVMVEHEVLHRISVHQNFKDMTVQGCSRLGEVDLNTSSRVCIMLKQRQKHHLGNARRVLANRFSDLP